jgi:hypothetical protein
VPYEKNKTRERIRKVTGIRPARRLGITFAVNVPNTAFAIEVTAVSSHTTKFMRIAFLNHTQFLKIGQMTGRGLDKPGRSDKPAAAKMAAAETAAGNHAADSGGGRR